MRRIITTLALAATMVLATASVALAAPDENAFCAGPETATHGGHITRDYVNDGGGTPPGVRGRASHSGGGVSPGASFCQGVN